MLQLKRNNLFKHLDSRDQASNVTARQLAAGSTKTYFDYGTKQMVRLQLDVAIHPFHKAVKSLIMLSRTRTQGILGKLRSFSKQTKWPNK